MALSITFYIHESWVEIFRNEIVKDYFKPLLSVLIHDYNLSNYKSPSLNAKISFNYITDTFTNDNIVNGSQLTYPNFDRIFYWTISPLDQLKVVILGQDPYHNGCANGLCFSANKGGPIPPSLANIFKELESDLCQPHSKNPDLTYLAKQGVLLLNSILTVKRGAALSHSHIGWEIFTDNIIQYINENKKNIVFILWGKYANSKSRYINQNNHYIVSGVHPSPLSSQWFFGKKYFTTCNEYLIDNGITPINWIE